MPKHLNPKARAKSIKTIKAVKAKIESKLPLSQYFKKK